MQKAKMVCERVGAGGLSCSADSNVNVFRHTPEVLEYHLDDRRLYPANPSSMCRTCAERYRAELYVSAEKRPRHGRDAANVIWTMSVVPPEGVDLFWPEVEGMLARAVVYSGGRMGIDDLHERLADGRYLLWVAHDGDAIRAAFATRIATYPRRKMLAVECAGGTGLREWIALAHQTFRDFARDSGLDGVEMYGRPGWDRVLSRYGWKRAMVVMEVDQRAMPQEMPT